MKTTLHQLPKNTAELIIELTEDEVRPYLNRAAERLSRTRPVPGFRPGKASYAVMEKAVGSDVLHHEAAEAIIRETYPKGVAEHTLTTVGAPDIALLKIAPGNPFLYKATVALLPDVTLGEYRGLKVRKRAVTVPDEEVEKLLNELRQTRSKETLVSRPAQMQDKVEIDFAGSRDGVSLEGATSKMHPLVLGSKQFIPGFEEEILGMRPSEKKQFTLRFPKDYHETALANQQVTFDVTLHAVYQVELPALDDAFAKSVGNFPSLAMLREQLKKNLIANKGQKERERHELAMLDAIVEISSFGELPDRLVDDEAQKMIDELHQNIEEQGMEFSKYLESIKKTADELKAEFRPRAEKRVRTALVTRAIAQKEQISVSDDEVKKEVEETRKLYNGNEQVEQNLRSPEYARYLLNVLTTKRVTEFLDDLIGIEEEAAKT